jgi:hypothetical protein
MISDIRIRARMALLGSSAVLGLLATPAAAQQAAPAAQPAPGAFRPDLNAVGSVRVEMEAYDASADLSKTGERPVAPEPFGGTLTGLDHVDPEPQIVIANPGTPTTARDPSNITGIAQMIVDNGGGGVGLCTGTLINPRTVIFAAHCVNTRAATAYGAASGGTGIGFGFETNLRANGPGQPDELLQWLLGGGGGPGQFKTNTGSAFYNVNQVRYNPLSLEPAANGFLYGDIALASFDTPAAGIPTWAMLFSALPGSANSSAAGTGYNVQLVGYGNNGSATTGSSGGIDFRRRIAENVIGALTDLKTFETFLFGSSTSPTANLYFLDFDDPRRGLSGASAFDFNAFRDNARVTGGVNTEGLTAAGDSGGPLILQSTFTRQIVAGVLSGGYTRFFNGQPANGYGTVSFYQPLFLYWDYIAANNPYRYVTNTGGDKLWTDPTNWVTTMDPNYFIIGANGQLVNGVPTDLGAGKAPNKTIQFGEICFQNSTSSDCLNTRTNVETVNNKPIGTDSDVIAPSNNAGSASLGVLTAGVTGWIDDIAPEAQASGGATTQALPPATLANGLPGATNFVPNNVDPVRTTGAMGRYFDVTLAAAGTTTLDSAVTVDRFSILGAPARLNITSAGTLTSLIDVTHAAGVVQVDGTLTSRGDYLFMGGGLMGSGRINTPFLTNISGAIAPGTAGTVGTLTVGGNLVLASASSLVIDAGPNGTSDRLAVVATTFNVQGAATNGRAMLGGTVALGSVQGSLIRAFDLYTILTAQGGISGQFNAPASLSAILRPEFIYTATAVQLRINAVPYATVVNQNSAVQRNFATLLDRNRAPGALPGLFDVLDLQNQATIQATLEALAPRTEPLRTSIGIAALDNVSRMSRERLNGLQAGNLGGQVAYYGRRVETAALSLAGLDSANATMSDVSIEPEMGRARLPENMSGFIAAGYLDGDSSPLPGTLSSSARDEFDGWYVAGGLETELGDHGVAGISFSYTDLEGTTGAGGQTVGGQLYAGTIYAKQTYGRLLLDTHTTAGLLETGAQRPGSLPGQAITLRSDDSALALSSEVGFGAMFGETIRFGPRVSARASWIDFSRIVESGGPTALNIDHGDYHSLQGRAGFVLGGVGRIRPNASVAYVHDFIDRQTNFGVNFVGSTNGANVLFDVAGRDSDWFEVSGGLTIDAGRFELSVSADSTIERDDVRNQSYRATARIRF